MLHSPASQPPCLPSYATKSLQEGFLLLHAPILLMFRTLLVFSKAAATALQARLGAAFVQNKKKSQLD